jgi:hypothetical protein
LNLVCRAFCWLLFGFALVRGGRMLGVDSPHGLHVAWADNYLTISGPEVPGGQVKTQYLEAYCRP